MVWQVIWSLLASADLDAIKAYLDANDPGAAESVIEPVLKQVAFLKSSPFIGAVVRDRPRTPVRETQAGKYRIYYRVLEAEGQIEIMRIWHASRRDPRSLN
jgi:plasmid stabilization system protein ParE